MLCVDLLCTTHIKQHSRNAITSARCRDIRTGARLITTRRESLIIVRFVVAAVAVVAHLHLLGGVERESVGMYW